ncbi:hypothetical protein FRC14_002503 [Serendipita sp. 396]|nr:hypothetical protein FRC14_002503 [Serendipita sp. 396]
MRLQFLYAALGTSLLGLCEAASIYLVGDSTMASHSASEGIQGWGVPIASGYFTIPIVNRAKSGSSARSWIRDGFWYNTKQLLKSGDYVVIELGRPLREVEIVFSRMLIPVPTCINRTQRRWRT